MVIGFSKIVVGIDGSEKSMEAAEYAISIAKMYNAQLIAINVWGSPIGYAFSPQGTGVPLPDIPPPEITLQAQEEAKKWYDEIKAEANRNEIQFRTEFIVAKKSVLSTILDYAEEQNIDLIVVGTRGRSGIKKMLLGSVASELVTYALCPLLVIK